MGNPASQNILQHHTARQGVIARLAREMTAILDPNELLRYTAQMIRDWLGYTYVHFFMIDQASHELVFVSDASREHALIERPDLRLPVGKGVAGWVAEHARLLNVGNVAVEQISLLATKPLGVK